MNFRSDNTASMHPKILEYLSREVGKHDKSYGSDASTQKLHLLLADIFETEVAVFPVTTGTAANALALAAITPRCSAIACHKGAHIFTDECAAPGFFCDSSPLIPIEGKNGKIGLDSLQSICELFSENDPQCSPVKTLSITQATEHGTIYSLAELEALSNFANANDIRLHMDGARFANALVALGCSPAEMTWKRGIDVLSLGATKNGTFCAEAILFFDQELAQGFVRHLKRSGHLLSKQRFMSEQLLALLNDGLWLETANKANQTAQTIAKAISEIPNAKVWGVTEANIVLASLPIAIAMTLEKQGVWFRCGPMSPLGMCECRFVTSFETTETEVAALSAVVASLGSIIAKGDKS